MSIRDAVFGNPLAATVLTLAEAAVHARRYGSSKTSRAEPDARTTTVVSDLRRDGIAVIPDFLGEDTCATLREAMDAALVAHPERAWVDPEGADHRLFAFNRVNAEASAFFAHRWIHEVGQQYAECDLVNLFTLAGRISATEGNRGSGGGWHRDSFARQFKAIVYLSDVDIDHGPFEFVAGTTQLKSVLGYLWRGLDFRQTRIDETTAERLIARKPETRRTVTAKAGSLVLADTRGIHRGMPITDGTRYALTNYYFARPDVNQDRIAHFNDNVPFADGKPLALEEALSFAPQDEAPEVVESC